MAKSWAVRALLGGAALSGCVDATGPQVEGRGPPEALLSSVAASAAGSSDVVLVGRTGPAVVSIMSLPDLREVGRIERAGCGAPNSAVSADGRALFVVLTCPPRLEKIDPRTGETVGSAALEPGTSPLDLALTPSGDRAFVTQFAAASVAAIDTRTMEVIGVIVLGPGDFPNGVTMGPGGRHVFVTNQGSGRVYVIDAASFEVVGEVGGDPANVNELAATRNGSTLLGTSVACDCVAVVDARSFEITATIPVAPRPVGIAIPSDGRQAYVVHDATPVLTVIDVGALEVVDEIPLPSVARRVAVGADGRHAVVSGRSAAVVDLRGGVVVATTSLDGAPWGVTLAKAQALSLDAFQPAGPSEITVTTTSDVDDFGGARRAGDLPGPDGVVSLREAIVAANNTPGPQAISFAIPPSDPGFDRTVFTIRPTGRGLPPVFGNGTVIDGSTQAAATGDTNPLGPEIVIDGSLTDGTVESDGLILESSDNHVHGLVIHGFLGPCCGGNGIIVNGDRNRVTGSYIGVDATGTAAVGLTDNGVRIGGSFNVFGGVAPGDRNVIGGVGAAGVLVFGNDNRIVGNFLGVDRTGGAPVGIAAQGVSLGGDRNAVGGPEPGEGNVIAGAGGGGVFISGSGNFVEGNLIGTDASGSTALGNGGGGVRIVGHPGTPAHGNRVANNVLSAAAIHGVGIFSATGTVVEGNRIGTTADGTAALPNGGIGVRVGGGPAGITSAGTRIVGNVIAAAGSDAVRLSPGPDGPVEGDAVVASNHIGVAPDGTAIPGSDVFWGIQLIGLAGVTIEDNRIAGVDVAITARRLQAPLEDQLRDVEISRNRVRARRGGILVRGGDARVEHNRIEIAAPPAGAPWLIGAGFMHFVGDAGPAASGGLMRGNDIEMAADADLNVPLMVWSGANRNLIGGNRIHGVPGDPGDISLSASTFENVVLGPLGGLTVVDDGTDNQVAGRTLRGYVASEVIRQAIKP